MFSVSIDDSGFITWLAGAPDAIRAALSAKTEALAQSLVLTVQQDRLSGQILVARSGALRDSITADTTADGDQTSATVYSAGDLPYAAIQEYGGDIPPHLIAASAAKALAFQVAGGLRFAKQVQFPGATIPAHDYLEGALDEAEDDIVEGMSEAVDEVLPG